MLKTIVSGSCLAVLAACGDPNAGMRRHTTAPTPDPQPVGVGPLAVPLNGPPPEVYKDTLRVELPAVPDFSLPAAASDGSHSVKELRVKSRKFLDSDLAVSGVITWAYDCATAIRTPEQTDKEVALSIEKDPTRCERAKFFVGDSIDTPVEKSLWVVDVPRPFNKIEIQRLPKQELKNPPPDRCDNRNPKAATCPIYKVGDQVVITGAFRLSSPHSERNSDGLLVYGKLNNVTRNWQSIGYTAPVGGTATVQAEPPELVIPKPSVAPRGSSGEPTAEAINASKAALAAGNKAFNTKQYDQAIVEFTRAADAWRENHLAYYGMGGSHAQHSDWGPAGDAFSIAVELAPTDAMYQMWFGISLYEKAVQNARDDQARRENKRPEEVRPDLSVVNFEKPLLHLTEAVRLNADLWRAHYYLGRVYREMDKPKKAGESFSKAIVANPRAHGPYIALGELYRKWDYTDHAIQIATLGTVSVSGQTEKSDIYFVLAMSQDDKRHNDRAIEAFTKAIENRRDNHKAKFQRGQAYFRIGDYVNAKRDLEEFSKSADASLGFAKQQANKMLMDIAAKRP